MSAPHLVLERSRGFYHLFVDGYHNPDWCPECIEPHLWPVEATKAEETLEATQQPSEPQTEQSERELAPNPSAQTNTELEALVNAAADARDFQSQKGWDKAISELTALIEQKQIEARKELQKHSVLVELKQPFYGVHDNLPKGTRTHAVPVTAFNDQADPEAALKKEAIQ